MKFYDRLRFAGRRKGRIAAMEHEAYMKEALALAREAAEHGEVPVGCVIVHGGEIVGR